MERFWKKAIAVIVWLVFALMILHAIFSIDSCVFIIGIIAEVTLDLNILIAFIYILALMNSYRVQPPPVQLIQLSGTKAKLRRMLEDLRPTIFSVPILVLITHLPFVGIPNIVFLVSAEKSKIGGQLFYSKFLLFVQLVISIDELIVDYY